MSVDKIKSESLGTARRIGKGGLHALAPDDFEYYACSFELINQNFEVLEFFNFPIMPDSISINEQKLVSFKKTGRSYLSQFNDSFVGKNISIKGTFGRKFRLLISSSKGKDLKAGTGGKFDLKVKTGYGAIKLMEKIIERANKVENDTINFLIFNNLSFNQSFIVEVTNFNPTMSLENNMFWNYALEMKALADVDEMDLGNNKSGRLIDSLSADLLSDTSTIIKDEVKKLIPTEAKSFLP